MYETQETTFYETISVFHPYVYSVWHVKRDNKAPRFTQSIRKANCEPKNMYCAFRTYDGVAELTTYTQKFTLTKKTLFFVPVDEIASYYAKEGVWDYVCFNFVSDVPTPYFTSKTIYSVPFAETEKNTVETILALNKTPSKYDASFASALFCNLFFQWQKIADSVRQTDLPYHKEIIETISFINENVETPLKISELANKANLSERSFLRAFAAHTGMPPKKYIINKKMQKSAILLITTDLSVQELSYKFGFYSPFQFSRDFKKHFGCSPTDYRARQKSVPPPPTSERFLSRRRNDIK